MKLSTTSKDFKVGQIIYTIPVQNAIYRGKPLEEQIKEEIIEKVSKTKITIKSGSFDIFGGEDRHNAGYLPFLSKEKALEYLKYSKELDSFRLNFNDFTIEDFFAFKDFLKSIKK